MLSERISVVFNYLGCNNSDVARFAECSPSLISRLRTGNRIPQPSSSSIMLLTEGIYKFSDNCNRLDVLCEICSSKSSNKEQLIPKIVSWLFENDDIKIQLSIKPSKQSYKKTMALSFGDRLNAVMNILNLSNSRLARQLNIDDSHISRFRNGIRSPVSNPTLSKSLATTLLLRTKETNMLPALSALTNINSDILLDEDSLTYFSNWLFEADNKSDVIGIDELLNNIDKFFLPTNSLPQLSFTLETFDATKSVYWGIAGLRQAVLRFLSSASQQKDSELWLYSDQSMEWLIGNEEYYSKWKALMLACIKNRTKIKIIHNIERNTKEMLAAISSWLPLYMSGLIESYVCHKKEDMRFSHTVFLCKDKACIFGTHIRDTEDKGWYEYISEQDKLTACKAEYESLLFQAEPLFRLFFDYNSLRIFDKAFTEKGDCSSLLSSLSLETMPEILLKKILKRNGIDSLTQTSIIAVHNEKQQKFFDALRFSNVNEFVPATISKKLFDGSLKVNLGTTLSDIEIEYNAEEYTEHLSAIIGFHNKSTNYNLFFLPETTFPGIQILQECGRVTVIKQSKPQVAFTFTNPYMLQAFDSYFNILKKKHKADRNEIRQILRKNIGLIIS